MRTSPPPVAEGSVLEPEEVDVRRRGTEGLAARLKAQIDAHKAEIFHLKNWKELYTRKYRAAKERIAELEHTAEETSRTHKEVLAKQDRHIKAMADELAQTKELLAVRSTELAGAQSFLSTKDRISESEVLDIVRDLNENIFQVAANLTEEWEKLRSVKPRRRYDHRITQEHLDSYSQSYGPSLIGLANRRKPPAVTYLVQMCLCDSATEIASSWHDKDSRVLRSVYQHLSASGGYISHTAGEMWLTHTRGTGNLGQMEVLDPQSPSQTFVSSRSDSAANRTRPLDHRVVLIH